MKSGITLFLLLTVALVLGACEGGDTAQIGKDVPDKTDAKTGDASIDLKVVDLEPELIPVNLLSVSPNFGPREGGTTVVLKGTGFLNGTRIYFGEMEAANTLVESLYLATCSTPAGDPGMVDVKVVLPDGREAVLEAAFSYVKEGKEVLKATAIMPEAGPAAGGFLCQLTGEGFESGVTVRMGANSATGLNIMSPTAMTFIAPEGTPGLVDVVVKLGDQSAVLPDGFEYLPEETGDPLTLSGVSPTKGPTEGGILALITGTGFEPGMSVQFGPETASVVEVSSANSMTVEVPAGQAGKVDVVVTLGEDVAILSGGFEYVKTEETVPLTLTSVQPTNGPTSGGTMCVVTGTGFVPGVQLAIGGEEVVFINVLSAEVLTFVTPPGEAGPADIAATLGDQEMVLEGAFTYVSAAQLSILSVDPDSGPVAGGTVCLLKGGGFGVDTSAYFGGQMAEILDVSSSGSMVVVTPAGKIAGGVDVTVMNTSGDSATLEAGFVYIQDEVFSVAKLQPSTGDVAGGYLAMLTGSGFEQGMSVAFCDSQADSVSVLSSNAEVITVAAGFPGNCDVVVENPDSETVSLEDGFLYTEEQVSAGAPSIGLLSPKKGPVDGGTWVMITGENFAPGVSASFGEVEAELTVRIDSSALMARTPASPPGWTDLAVANPDGKISTLANAFQFLVVEDPAVDLAAIAPASGPVTGGTACVLTGENFKPGAKVYFGFLPAESVTYLSALQLVAVTPPGEIGPQDIVVVNPDGTTDRSSGGYLLNRSPVPARELGGGGCLGLGGSSILMYSFLPLRRRRPLALMASA